MSATELKRCIVSCGMPRSGSTWQFNLVRSMIKHLEPYASWVEHYDPTDICKTHLIKAHNPDISLFPPSTIWITSYRDLRAVAGSMVRMRWIVDDPVTIVDMCRNYIYILERLESVAHRVSRYEDIVNLPLSEAAAIETAIGLEGSGRAWNALRFVESLRPAHDRPTGTFESYDAESHLHNGHIGARLDSVAVSELTSASRAAIEDEFGDWLRGRGYVSPLSEVH